MFIDAQKVSLLHFLHPFISALLANDIKNLSCISLTEWTSCFSNCSIAVSKALLMSCRWFMFMWAHVSSTCFITVANRWPTLLITHPSPSCRDERWTYMYKADPAAAAVPSLVIHCRRVTTGLHVFDLHASWPVVQTVPECTSQKNWEPRLKPPFNQIHVILKRVITNFQCMYLFYWKLLYLYKFSETSEGFDDFNVCRML